ncbi:MAG: hypothetical protein QOF24_1353 [Verrucomicrobiota bacterium]
MRHLSLRRALNRTGGAALVIVLAFVVLLAGIVVACLTRMGTNRQLAHGTFNQANSDQVARTALAIIVADLKQEIADGSSTSNANGATIYTATVPANMVPQRNGTQVTTPNLVRRSVNSDSVPSPGVGSRASAVNSTTDASSNGRFVSTARWNRHYLLPKSNLTNDDSDPVASFVAPDWVIVSRSGPAVQSGIGTGSTALNNQLITNSNYVIGRYAYAVYDEGGLLDINIAGFPSPTPAPATIAGRKGSVAFADLTALPTTGSSFVSNTAINRVIGWRNYATMQPAGTFPGFTFSATASSAFASYFLDPARNFGIVASAVSGGKTDQAFVSRSQLIEFRADVSASVNMLQYLGTFSREINHSTWNDSIGRLAFRFPLSRFDLFATTPPSTANAALIQRYFGLVYVPVTGPTAEHWQYAGISGTGLLVSIPPVSGTAQTPDLFPLLQYALPAAAMGEILSIGASLIDQRDSNLDTTWIEYAPAGAGLPAQKAFGVDTNPSTEPGAPARPASVLVLNHEFRSVGDLGYAYRNASTSIDFRTTASNDAPLLDLFTYNTATPRSGIINLNTRNASVLAAILKGAITTDSSSAAVTGNVNPTTAANSIVSATTTQPALGRQDLVRLASSSVVTNSPFTTSEETRETITRALAEVAQTRTWGLLIDVIAQSGRYPPNAASGPNLANPLANFVVEGEKRYWLHVAIDRFTGEIIDQQLEAVYE